MAIVVVEFLDLSVGRFTQKFINFSAEEVPVILGNLVPRRCIALISATCLMGEFDGQRVLCPAVSFRNPARVAG